MRAFAILPLLLALTACWGSKDAFYTPDPRAAAPIQPGRYADPAAPAQVVRFTRRADGRYIVAEVGKEDKAVPVVFAPLAMPGHKLFVTQAFFDLPQWHSTLYELVEQKPDGTLLLAVLKCEGNERLARQAGATVTSDPQFNGGKPSCLFPTRAALETAVRAYARAHDPLPAEGTLRRIGA